MKPTFGNRSLAIYGLATLLGSLCLASFALPGRSEEPPGQLPSPRELPSQTSSLTFSQGGAVRWALDHNPVLGTFRKQRGIAQAAFIVSQQYPFNPIIQHYMWYGNGPASAGVTNHFFQEHTSRLDLELFHQGRYRQGAAREALTRTEWEIAAQELLVSIQTARAFSNYVYRRGKYRLLEESTNLTEDTAKYIDKLVQQGALRADARLMANVDVAEARAAFGPGRGLLVVAENDLRRALGLIGEDFDVKDTLEKGFESPEERLLAQSALEKRPDLNAFKYAVREAENRLRFEIANRWGNPSMGPSGEVNETSVGFIGLWLIWSAPVINTRKGEIRQREAEKARAIEAVHQSEVQVQQDVHAALKRLKTAESVVQMYRTDTLPKLRQALESVDKLFEQGQPNIDLAKLIDIRRRLLKARDAYLDSLLELSQAQADLAAAVGDLSFIGCLPDAPLEGNNAQTVQAGKNGEGEQKR